MGIQAGSEDLFRSRTLELLCLHGCPWALVPVCLRSAPGIVADSETRLEADDPVASLVVVHAVACVVAHSLDPLEEEGVPIDWAAG